VSSLISPDMFKEVSEKVQILEVCMVKNIAELSSDIKVVNNKMTDVSNSLNTLQKFIFSLVTSGLLLYIVEKVM
jgi:hypothetical protein